MELRQLKYFVKSAEYLNFSEAAKHLYITQSTLSQQIKQLEFELGFTLFLRNSRHISLTEAGEDGCNFPVLCNPNVCRLDAQADANGIDVKIFDVNSTLLHTYQLKK